MASISKGVLIFCASFALVMKLCDFSEGFRFFLQQTGWFVLSVSIAGFLTKRLLYAIPGRQVDPTDKVVLITGCDTGFGHSLAQRLSKIGFIVYAGCLDEDGAGAQVLKERCPKSKIHVLPLDVTKNDQVHAALKRIESELEEKVFWALINNAGVAIFSEIEWCSMSIIEHMFNVNVMGAMRVTKAFLPLLRRSSGRVVVVSSVSGHVTYPGFLTYSMTKHALVSFADGLRREMRKWNIAVSAIEPSMYRTRITASDVLTGALDNSWEKTPEPIKEAYGFPYYSDFRSRMQKLATKARPYLEEVVDSMERAVMEIQPRTTYRCAGPIDKVRIWFMSMLPVQLQDLLICRVIQPSHRHLSRIDKSS